MEPVKKTTREQRLALVSQMADLNLPVGTPDEMKRESVTDINAASLKP